MDLSAFHDAHGLVAVHVRERTIAGPGRGVVVRYVLELEWATGARTLIEETVPESQAFNLAAFEAFIRDLNRVLDQRRDDPPVTP